MYDPNSMVLGAFISIAIIIVCWTVFKIAKFIENFDFVKNKVDCNRNDIIRICDRLNKLEEESKND